MYLTSFHRQNERIQRMVTVRRDEEKMEVFFHDPDTGELWKSFFPRGYSDKSSPKLLRPEPPPGDIEEQIDESLSTNLEETARGLGLELSSEPEKWPQIIQIIDKNRKKYTSAMISAFLDELGIYDPELIFSDLGASAEAFDLDDDTLKQLKKASRMIKIKKFFRI